MTPKLRDTAHLCDVLGIPFSDEQLAAVTSAPDVPSVIIAGAGSGKTAVMAARVVWLVGHEGFDPSRVLGLTFTNKAAAELGVRVRASLDLLARDAGVTSLTEELGEPTVSTYHAFAGALIDEHGLRLGYETDLRVTPDASRYQRAARCVAAHRGALVHVSTSMSETVRAVLSLDGSLSEHLVTTEEMREHDRAVIADISAQPTLIADLNKGIEAAHKRIELSRLVDDYREAKAADGVMDFSDQMSRGALLGISSAEVSTDLRERFGAVMLDEYQDTSVAQRRMLQGLFSGETPAEGRGHCVTAVGDPTQSIYGWRGAAGDNLQRFAEHFPAASGELAAAFQLRTSRRCEADILEVANAVAAPYYEANPTVRPLLAAAPEPCGNVSVARHATVSAEIAAVVENVREVGSRRSWSDIAILLRNREEMATLTAALREAGIPAEVLGLDGLLSQPEVVEVTALLHVVADAAANPAMVRLLTSARWRIGGRDLALLGRRARILASGFSPASDGDDLDAQLRRAVAGADPTEVISLSDAVDDPGTGPYSAEALERFGQLSALIADLRRHVADPLVDLVSRAIRRSGIDIEAALMPGREQAVDNLALLVDTAADFAATAGHASLVGFLAYLRAEEDFNGGMGVAEPPASDAVTLLTVHKSKGLEWPAVLVPFLAEGVFPSTRARERWTSNGAAFPVPLRGDADSQPRLGTWSGPELRKLAEQFRADAQSEELRLAYVAFTRAKSELHLSGHWWGRTQAQPRKPSIFLETAHEWALAKGQAVGVWADPPADETNPHADVEPVAWPPAPARLTTRRRTAYLFAAIRAGEPVQAATGASLSALDEEIERLLAEAREQRDTVVVRLPDRLSTTSALAWNADPAGFAQQLARPMPRQPSAAARAGTRFHAWVEARFGQQTLLDPVDLPGRGDADIGSDAELDELFAAFAEGPYGDSSPYAIEAPFSIVLGGQQIIGRIDAVYETRDGFEVVDWKTNRRATADPLQLAIYRLAWAELHGLDPAAVTGAFYYVRLGEVRRFDDLPDRAELERRLGLA